MSQKILNIGISPGLWLIKKGNGDSNTFYKLQLYSMQIFFQNGDLFFQVAKTTRTCPLS